MTTQAWTSRLRHDSDATFREWGSEFSARLAACGLIQHTDTGQVNWASVTRPGANTEGGFEVWRFDDALQGTAPIFLRVGYGTGSGTTSPAISITVGTGTNGSGTLSGTALTSNRRINGSAVQTADTTRASFMCHTEGFFGVSWKHGSSNSVGGFIVDRTCDNAGVKSATGAIVSWGSGSVSAAGARQALRFASPAETFPATTAANTSALGLMAQCPANSTVGSDQQVALGFTITPRAVPLNGVCGV
jgi:hypothetical protein